ncbi:MAG: enoyl-CoA hydratase, partial [Acidimicrobiales bacterium]
GLVNRVVASDQLAAQTHAYATDLAATVSRRSLAETRRQIWLDQHRDVRSAIEAAAPLLDEMMGEEDYAKGVAALVAKEPPGF